ncbi:hypothetical protein [Streptomyces sp. N35]|uniref:hypothetical protein n=1 Tax=Streptomyces sp. N35 TaxID=2795730 RepID=UPI0018F3A643|nr:hypothetical protein [Streptomyces sp. N35]
METRIAEGAQEAGAPPTVSEEEQADHAFDVLARSEGDPRAVRASRAQLALVQPFFELGWIMGVRTGHTGPAMTDVPLAPHTVRTAFRQLLRYAPISSFAAPQPAEPVLWQKVRYHGSRTHRHGLYWVYAITAVASQVGGPHELRYSLCHVIDGKPVPVVMDAGRGSLTPHSEYYRTPL